MNWRYVCCVFHKFVVNLDNFKGNNFIKKNRKAVWIFWRVCWLFSEYFSSLNCLSFVHFLLIFCSNLLKLLIFSKTSTYLHLATRFRSSRTRIPPTVRTTTVALQRSIIIHSIRNLPHQIRIIIRVHPSVRW